MKEGEGTTPARNCHRGRGGLGIWAAEPGARSGALVENGLGGQRFSNLLPEASHNVTCDPSSTVQATSKGLKYTDSADAGARARFPRGLAPSRDPLASRVAAGLPRARDRPGLARRRWPRPPRASPPASHWLSIVFWTGLTIVFCELNTVFRGVVHHNANQVDFSLNVRMLAQQLL